MVDPQIRIVFSFKKPIHPEHFKGPKFATDSLLREMPDYGRFFLGIANHVFPNYKKLGNDRDEFLQYRLSVENLVDISGYIDNVVGQNLKAIFHCYKEADRYCIAFERREKHPPMNLAGFYNQIKKSNSEIFIRKNYNSQVTQDEVIANENKFADQGVEFYIEIPLNLHTGAWFRIDLKPKGQYKIERTQENDISYYYVMYSWEATSYSIFIAP